MTLPFLPKAKGTPGGRLFWYVLLASCVIWITLFYFQRPSRIPISTTAESYASAGAADASSNSSSRNQAKNNSSRGGGNKNSRGGVDAIEEFSRPPPTIQPPLADPCAGRYIYTHELPTRFNTDILDGCRALSKSANKSQFMSNEGLGPRVEDPEGVFAGSGSWYQTDQFALDVIFYNRMKRHFCLTNDSSRAAAIFVPFFAGLDASRYLAGHNTTVRDAMPLDLVRWLRSRPEWWAMGGRDHFLVAGRPAWDFRRFSEFDSDWGNKLLLVPETRNMSVLVLESSIWLGNDISIPYPTYFHPSDDGETIAWQNRVRKAERPWLFSFVGAGRSDPLLPGSMRGRIIEQCRASRRCRHLDCSSNATACSSPGSVMAAFQGTVFCLQPPGDSFTRRSTFDAMVAGCVPVFFHRGSSDEQYKWHLPRNHSSYSVLIPEEEVRDGKVSIEKRLVGIPEGEVRAMREEVIRMIPRLVYAKPGERGSTAKDAFEVAVEGVIERVSRRRKEMRAQARAPRQTDKGVGPTRIVQNGQLRMDAPPPTDTYVRRGGPLLLYVLLDAGNPALDATVYIHDLPSQFNTDILRACLALVRPVTLRATDFSIPYPSNFHPSHDGKVERLWLFSFVGAPHPPPAGAVAVRDPASPHPLEAPRERHERDVSAFDAMVAGGSPTSITGGTCPLTTVAPVFIRIDEEIV
ncbi:hypothetical protein Taro_049628 [Colocasia esculenta]|uniref:Exostosin GT47 domain-containing protein n=1 Tax=Colocasia esculenta TaxID=4460 RepID=A0A843XBJ4_COLES|nr:hypothetical protein [Colocasia esculenta]